VKGGADGTAVAADEEEAAFGRRAVNWEKKKHLSKHIFQWMFLTSPLKAM